MKFRYKTIPFLHQKEVFRKVRKADFYAFFWEMGLGKSKITVDCIRYKCYKQNKALRVLVVCPKIVMENWKNEFLVHSNIKRIQLLHGSKAKRIAKIRYPADVNVINYQGLHVVKEELLKTNYDVLIVDESQRVKNTKAQCSKIVLALSKRIKYRYLLSGTPVLNKALDIFNQYRILDGGETFGTNFFAFRNTYFEDENIAFKNKKHHFTHFVQKPDTTAILNEKISKYADIKYKKDCLDLPDKVFQRLYPEMTPEIRKAYKEMEKEMITFLEEHADDPGIASTALVKIVRLAQISSGFMKLDISDKEVRFKKNPKVEAIKEVLNDLYEEHKVIIWASFVNNIKYLAEELSMYNPAVIYGAVKDKQAQIEKFNTDPTCRVLVANPKSVGIGVNLVVADYAIYYSMRYDLEPWKQSQDRNHRIGSERFSKIVYLILIYKNTIDEVIYNSLERKEDLASALLAVKKQLIGGSDCN